MRPMANDPVPDLGHVDVWIFDLDNTLYPSHCDLFAQIDRRMGEFIARHLEVPFDEAKRLQKGWFEQHGTTLRGLMLEHEMAPDGFLDYVHEIDLSPIPRDGVLASALTRLPGRKVIFTNATRRHAERITRWLEIHHHFETVFDIVDANYLPKPDRAAYAELLLRLEVEGPRAAMVEDMARNLAPAAELGMTTVWVPTGTTWSKRGAEDGHIDHVVPDLGPWLHAVADRLSGQDGGPRAIG